MVDLLPIEKDRYCSTVDIRMDSVLFEHRTVLPRFLSVGPRNGRNFNSFWVGCEEKNLYIVHQSKTGTRQ